MSRLGSLIARLPAPEEVLPAWLYPAVRPAYSPSEPAARLALRRIRFENRFFVHLALWLTVSSFLLSADRLTGGADTPGVMLSGLWGAFVFVQGGLALTRGRARLEARRQALLQADGKLPEQRAMESATEIEALRKRLLQAAEDVRDVLRPINPEALGEVSRGETRALALAAWLDDGERQLQRHQVERRLRREVAERLARAGSHDHRRQLLRLLEQLDLHDRLLGSLERRVAGGRERIESFLLALENVKIAGGGADNLGVAAAALSERVAVLEETAGPAAGAGRGETESSAAADARIREEVRLAQDLQRSILPASAPAVAGLTVAHVYRPSSEVGGDFYDFYVPRAAGGADGPGERLLVALGDASGHGLDSSMVSSMAKSALYMQLSSSGGEPEGMAAEGTGGGDDGIGAARLAVAMAGINRMMCDTLGRRRLMTLALVELDAGRGTISWVNAGQVYPLLRRGGEVRELEQPGYPLGVRHGTRYRVDRHLLQPGDLLLLLTDGYVEACSRDGEPLGWERLAEGLARSRAADPGEILDALLEDLERHLQGTPPQDDVTLVAIGVEP